ncbi:hypothetical protein NpPPO83_00007628 [Neofusicoccum parvum]|uniref:Uncharacterized protein n=1 Tax=Neofusicoccum parvum TaxID=310453 RepID=A0ACB5SBR8_9PEZI|nr:hypothetical protein NpPPO83_00007628 [Neofusicoccum parvum]
MPDFLASLVEDHMDNFVGHLDDMQTGTELTLGEFVDDAKLEPADARSQHLREVEEVLQCRIEDVRKAADEIGEEVGSRFVDETEELGGRITELTQAVRRVEALTPHRHRRPTLWSPAKYRRRAAPLPLLAMELGDATPPAELRPLLRSFHAPATVEPVVSVESVESIESIESARPLDSLDDFPQPPKKPSLPAP